MAGRPPKEGLDYFELDCHLDEKIRLIQAEFGLKGFAVVVLLFQRIYGERGYYMIWDEDASLLFMSENGVAGGDKNLINEIVSACIKRDIFSKELFEKYRILTSSGIQKRYLRASAKRETRNLKKEYLLINDGKNSISSVNNSISDVNNSISSGRNATEKIREEKKRKRVEEDYNIVFGPKKFESIELNEAFFDYVQCRDKPVKGRLLDVLVKQLMDAAGGDEDVALQIVRKSTVNGWNGFYPLNSKKEPKTERSSKSKNKFNNFKESGRDFNKIVDDLMNTQKPLGNSDAEKKAAGEDT